MLAGGRGAAVRGSRQCEHRGAGVRGSWDRGAESRGTVAGSVSTEVRKPEIAGAEVQPPEAADSEEKVQQLEVAGESDYPDSEVQCVVCEPE